MIHFSKRWERNVKQRTRTGAWIKIKICNQQFDKKIKILKYSEKKLFHLNKKYNNKIIFELDFVWLIEKKSL